MESLKPGDSITHLMLKEAITLPPAITDKHLTVQRHPGIVMTAHEKGVWVEYGGHGHLIYEGALVSARKAKEEPKPEVALEAKRGPGRPPKQPEVA